MRNFLLLLYFFSLTSFVFASPNTKSETQIQSGEFVKGIRTDLERSSFNDHRAFDCTVTVEASVGYSNTYIKASCSATASTCSAATDQAAACIKAAITKARKAIEQ